jgi:hypothetical protein
MPLQTGSRNKALGNQANTGEETKEIKPAQREKGTKTGNPFDHLEPVKNPKRKSRENRQIANDKLSTPFFHYPAAWRGPVPTSPRRLNLLLLVRLCLFTFCLY